MALGGPGWGKVITRLLGRFTLAIGDCGNGADVVVAEAAWEIMSLAMKAYGADLVTLQYD